MPRSTAYAKPGALPRMLEFARSDRAGRVAVAACMALLSGVTLLVHGF